MPASSHFPGIATGHPNYPPKLEHRNVTSNSPDLCRGCPWLVCTDYRRPYARSRQLVARVGSLPPEPVFWRAAADTEDPPHGLDVDAGGRSPDSAAWYAKSSKHAF